MLMQILPRVEVERARRSGFLPVIAVAIGAAMTIGLVNAGADDKIGEGGNGDNPYAIGLWGDLPYSSIQATVGVPNLIADMNSQNLSFTVHDGDLKSGSTVCTDAVYTQALGYFSSLRAPAILTPGDNDWVDCDRTAGFDALVQLDKERALYFSTSFTLGQKTFRTEVQSTPLCLSAGGSTVPCVENRRWKAGSGHFRYSQHPGFVQQPLWRPARPERS